MCSQWILRKCHVYLSELKVKNPSRRYRYSTGSPLAGGGFFQACRWAPFTLLDRGEEPTKEDGGRVPVDGRGGAVVPPRGPDARPPPDANRRPYCKNGGIKGGPEFWCRFLKGHVVCHCRYILPMSHVEFKKKSCHNIMSLELVGPCRVAKALCPILISRCVCVTLLL